jgi:hypothetical protein
MLRIDDYIFSLDILEKRFICDLNECLGGCCRYGDSGAPLTEEEVLILRDILPDISPYLRKEGLAAIVESGTSIKDFENDNVTPLIAGAECAYTIMDKGIFKCGIEKAWEDGNVKFRKPLSCHLFPVRKKRFSSFTAVNYVELPICSGARQKGIREKVFVYEFLREPLIRALGEKIYEELCIAARELRKSK